MTEVEIVGPSATIRFHCFDDATPSFIPAAGDPEPLQHEPQPQHVHYPIVCAIIEDILAWKVSTWHDSYQLTPIHFTHAL